MYGLKTLILASAISVGLLSAQADSTNIVKNPLKEDSSTNSNCNSNTVMDANVYLIHDKKDDFWLVIDKTISKKAEQIANDRLGPMNRLNLMRIENRLRYDFINERNRIGQRIFEVALVDSARDIFADSIPEEQLEENLKSGIIGFLTSFFKGSVGNTEEEHVNTVSAIPQSFSLYRDKWLVSKQKNGVLDYGVKPFRKNPYFYSTIGVGHVNHKPVILNLRVYSMLMDSKAGNPKLEINTILACTKTSQILIGGSMYPAELNKGEHKPAASIRYERILFKDIKNKFWSLGASSNGTDGSVNAMFHMTW